MTKLPPLIELRAFDAAARHLSFKKAAFELGVTPTAISHQIRLLERYRGCPLFRRRPRPLSLTEDGARLFLVMRDGLQAFATAIASVKRDVGQQPLRITTTNAFASRWLLPRLPRWRKLNPHAPLDAIGTDRVLDLQSGDADVAIRYTRSAPTDGIAKEFLSDSFFAFCSPKMQSTGIKRATGLRGHVLVHSYWTPSDIEAPTWQRWLDAARRKWRQVQEPKDMEHLSFREELHAIEAVIAGQGIGIFSVLSWRRSLHRVHSSKPSILACPVIASMWSEDLIIRARRSSTDSQTGCSQTGGCANQLIADSQQEWNKDGRLGQERECRSTL